MQSNLFFTSGYTVHVLENLNEWIVIPVTIESMFVVSRCKLRRTRCGWGCKITSLLVSEYTYTQPAWFVKLPTSGLVHIWSQWGGIVYESLWQGVMISAWLWAMCILVADIMKLLNTSSDVCLENDWLPCPAQ